MKLSKAQNRALKAIGERPGVSIEHYPHGPFAPNTIRSLEKAGLITVSAGRRWGREAMPSEEASITKKGLDLLCMDDCNHIYDEYDLCFECNAKRPSAADRRRQMYDRVVKEHLLRLKNKNI